MRPQQSYTSNNEYVERINTHKNDEEQHADNCSRQRQWDPNNLRHVVLRCVFGKFEDAPETLKIVMGPETQDPL